MPSLKIELIGCGRIAQLVHLNILTSLPDVELVAIADSHSGRRKEAVRRAPKVVAFDNYQELLEMPEVEAVVICLPPALHADAAIASFEAGKHLYLENPIATSLADAREVVGAWRKAGTVGMIGFNYRFNLLYQSAKQFIQSRSSRRLGRRQNGIFINSIRGSRLEANPERRRRGIVGSCFPSHRFDSLSV